MRITKLEISNYRTLDDVTLDFPAYYSAICGKNNAGKTNLLKAIRMLLREQMPFVFGPPERITFKDDFPMWKSKSEDARIKIAMSISVNHERDAGLHKFVETFAKVTDGQDDLVVRVTVSVGPREEDSRIVVDVNGTVLDDYPRLFATA